MMVASSLVRAAWVVRIPGASLSVMRVLTLVK